MTHDPHAPVPPPLPDPSSPSVLPYLTPGQEPIDRRTIVQFRQQIHALGGLWVFFGCVSLGLGLLILSGGGNPASAVLGGGGVTAESLIVSVMLGLGTLWLVAGVFSFLKHIWAVYVGLVFSYLFGISSLLQFNVCSIVIAVLIILQAHRVIGWAGRMRAAGVSLNTKP